MDSLFVVPQLTIRQAQKLLGVNCRSASQNIQKLVKAGIVHDAGATLEGRVFVARDILRAVAETD